ncbi:C40 family peptidase [Sphingomonas bacterium]|uniref:C40 family peptidase n=1 Tax=Sphingomonas bacterium TaxID=1895847 RepID=UPI001576B46B|nr:NlpC/P60 family protein [Sphingomonas bacterium]
MRPGPAATSSARWPDRFRLTGPSCLPDPRTHAYRRDIADVGLAGALFAPHYARAVDCRVESDQVMLRGDPSDDARATSQLLRGESFALLDLSGDWAWGRCLHDDYVGYLPRAALAAMPAPDHRVTAMLAPVFARPDIKAPVVATWPISARFEAKREGDFLACGAGYVHVRHAQPISATAADPVGVAEGLLGLPYLWGGRGAGGIDCSGLVQIALGFAGVAAPRDSDQQRESLGAALAPEAPLRRGDLIFFPGHVGMMADEATLLHATALWMAVVREPLADVVARLAPDLPEPIVARRRLA